MPSLDPVYADDVHWLADIDPPQWYIATINLTLWINYVSNEIWVFDLDGTNTWVPYVSSWLQFRVLPKVREIKEIIGYE